MAIASGVAKRVAIRKETAWGDEGTTISTRTGGTYMRRISSDISLKKETYESEEMRTDYQVADFRHGVRSVGGSISGELASAGAVATSPQRLLLAALCRKVWAAGGTAASCTAMAIADGTLPLKTLTRTGGSNITDGFKIGDVITILSGTGATTQVGQPLLVVSMTATVMTVLPLNGAALLNASLTVAVAFATKGWKTYVPATGHTDDSFLIEHFFSDIAQSELFSGCKVQSCNIDLPPSGISKIGFEIMGRDMLDTTARRGSVATTAEYFTTPAAAPSTGVMSAVNGVVSAGGSPMALLTGLSIKIDGNMSAEPVVGSNVYQDISEGRVKVSGEMSVFFQDATMRDAFVNETSIEICAAFSAGSANSDDFIAITLPRVKLGGADKSDGEKGLTMTMPYTAILGTGTGAGAAAGNALATTISFQDSAITA